CGLERREELVDGYATGRLGEDDAARFEEHFFGCDACWAELERARAIRSAFARIPVSTARAETRRPRLLWPRLALAAAGLAAIAVLPLLRQRSVGRPPAPTPVWRGTASPRVT